MLVIVYPCILENELIDSRTICYENETSTYERTKVGKLKLDGCFQECANLGSSLFDFGSTGSDTCDEDGACECKCYDSDVTLDDCQLQKSNRFDLYRIVDIDKKVSIILQRNYFLHFYIL